MLAIIEAIYNILDLGFFAETIRNASSTRVEMGKKAFLKRLILGVAPGKGYREMTPVALFRQLDLGGSVYPAPSIPLIIDLRDRKKFRQQHIPGAILHPFDDFLRDILLHGQNRIHRGGDIVLVCDGGFKSRVAAGILSEEGFSRVYSLNRGMRRWRRWLTLLATVRQARNRCIVCRSLLQMS